MPVLSSHQRHITSWLNVVIVIFHVGLITRWMVAALRLRELNSCFLGCLDGLLHDSGFLWGLWKGFWVQGSIVTSLADISKPWWQWSYKNHSRTLDLTISKSFNRGQSCSVKVELFLIQSQGFLSIRKMTGEKWRVESWSEVLQIRPSHSFL